MRRNIIIDSLRNGDWASQYRTRDAIAGAKAARGGSLASTWFLKGTTLIITVTATPGFTL